MTNQELKAFCIEFLCEYPTDIDSDRRHFDMAHSTLRLLAENEAMRGVVDACRDMWIKLSDDERKQWDTNWLQRYDVLSAALSKLPPGAGNEQS